MGGALPPSAYAFPETALTVPPAVPAQWLPSAPGPLPSLGYPPPHSRGSYASWLQPPPDPIMAPATLAPITPHPAPTPAGVPSSATGAPSPVVSASDVGLAAAPGAFRPIPGFQRDPVRGGWLNPATGARYTDADMRNAVATAARMGAYQ